MKRQPNFEFKYDLLETHFMPDVWKVLISCILLNRTTRKQVDKVIYKLFETYQNPRELGSANENDLVALIKPLGFYNRRSKTLIKFSKAYHLGFKEVSDLPGIGEYAKDAYKILFLRDLSFTPKDKALKNFIKFVDKDFTICPTCYEQLMYLDQCKWCGWQDTAKEWRWNILTSSLKLSSKKLQKLKPMIDMKPMRRQFVRAVV